MNVMSGVDDGTKEDLSSVRPKLKLSKRVNARLQLAAALIEADNEELEARKRVLERMHSISNNTFYKDFYTKAAPLPAPRLASESVIFAPYRSVIAAQDDDGNKQSGLDSEGRPLIDFLGVKLPTEKKRTASSSVFEGRAGGHHSGGKLTSTRAWNRREWGSRPVSMAASALTTSRPSSLASTQHIGAMDDCLEEWGVEKFVTSEDQERIATGRRSRACSEVGIERPSSAQSHHSLTGSKALSETGTRRSGAVHGDVDRDNSKTDLLTRIKRYRDGQGLMDGEGTIQLANLKVSEDEKKEIPCLETRLGAPSQGEEGGGVSVASPAMQIDTRSCAAKDEGNITKAGVLGHSRSEQADVSSEQALNRQALPQEVVKSGLHASNKREKEISNHDAISAGTSKQQVDNLLDVDLYSGSDLAQRNPLIPAPGCLSRPALHGKASDFKGDSDEGSHSHPANMTRSVSADAPSSLERQSLPIPKRPSSALAGSFGASIAHALDTIPKRSSLLKPGVSPRLRPCTPDDLLAAFDPYPEITYSGLSPYPALHSPHIDSSNFQSVRFSNGAMEETSERLAKQGRRGSMAGLSTKQLQELAKGNTLPATCDFGQEHSSDMTWPVVGIALYPEGGLSQIFAAELRDQNDLEHGRTPPEGKETPSAGTSPFHEWKEQHEMQETEDDRAGLPSPGQIMKARTSILTDKIRRRLSTSMSNISPSPSLVLPAGEADIDDDYTSPPTRGSLCPRGLQAHLPVFIVVPQPLQGTSLAPRRRLVEEEEQKKRQRLSMMSNLHVPKGFVLHNRVDGVPMKALQVQGPTVFVEATKHKDEASKAMSEALQYSTRVIAVPRAAPAGIGKRAAMDTTALFRNQLVQNEDEKEGWGWESGSRARVSSSTASEEGSNGMNQQEWKAELAVKKSGQDKRAGKKLQKEKRKRKAARRLRREKRAMAESKGLPYEQVGVDEYSPDEDLHLSSSTSEEEESESEGHSDAEARRLDEMKPAGALYGKSLLDVMDERRKVVTSKARHYGQVAREEQKRDDASIVALSIGAASFRDNPVGFNDTRERMEAAFGADPIWASETAKREKQETEEALEARRCEVELAAGEERRKMTPWRKLGRGRKGKVRDQDELPTESIVLPPNVQTIPESVRDVEVDGFGTALPQQQSQSSLEPPTIHLSLPQKDRSLVHETSSLTSPAAPWYEVDDDDDETSEDSEWEAQRNKPALQLDSKMAEPVLAVSESDSGEDDDVPLSHLREMKTSAVASSYSRLDRGRQDSDEEEEMPLSQLVEHRRKTRQSLGTLDLNFMFDGDKATQEKKPAMLLGDVSGDRGSESESDEDVPLGLRLANAETALRNLLGPKKRSLIPTNSDSDDDDDRPLGATHPQAAIIAEQANLIKQLQAEIAMEQRRSHIGLPLPSFNFPVTAPMSFVPGLTYPIAPPASDMSELMMAGRPLFSPPLQQREDSIVNWASQIPPDGATSAPHSQMGNDRSLLV